MGGKKSKNKANEVETNYGDDDAFHNLDAGIFDDNQDPYNEYTNNGVPGGRNAHFQGFSRNGQTSKRNNSQIPVDGHNAGWVPGGNNTPVGVGGNGGWGQAYHNNGWDSSNDTPHGWGDNHAADNVWGIQENVQWNGGYAPEWNQSAHDDWSNARQYQGSTVPKVTITSPSASSGRKNNIAEQDGVEKKGKKRQGKQQKQQQKQQQQQQQQQQQHQHQHGWAGENDFELPEDTAQYNNGWFSGIASGWDKPTAAVSSKPYALAANGNVNNMVSYGNHGNELTFIDSKGEALTRARRALFSQDRLARDRLHWLFSPEKDERVRSLLEWIQDTAYPLASYGLQCFLRTRERGALISNADFRPLESPHEPAFDWITYEDSRMTKDRTLQESIAFYDPSTQVLVFVFLLSKTENSMAIWRRKLAIPNNLRLTYGREIAQAKAGLQKQYPIFLDEMPSTSDDAQQVRNAAASKPRRLTKRKWLRWLS